MNDIVMQYEKFEARAMLAEGRECDQYDYTIAVFSGTVAGLVDSFFVGKPNVRDETNSKLGSWTDQMSVQLLSKIADKQIANDYKLLDKLQAQGLTGEALRDALVRNGAPENLSRKGYPEFKDKVVYLENKYRVPYDTSSVSGLGITPVNHHIKSLAHCPDIIGLCCAIIDQFTDTTTMFYDGGLIHIQNTGNRPELRGTNLISKLFCAICNWAGHLLSDYCGSHSSKGRGMGIPIPFFELFQLCDFGNFSISGSDVQGGMTLADISVKVFENGYDARYGFAMAIPLLLSDCMIRLLWALKHRFYHKEKWSDCIPDKTHKDLRMMLLVGNATLCAIDGVDAAIRSKGELVEFFLHTNYVAWLKLAVRACREIMIRYNFSYEDLLTQFAYLNYQMDCYLARLKEIDYVSYELQFSELNEIQELLGTGDIENASKKMSGYIDAHGIDTSFRNYDGFFDEMNDPDAVIRI